MKIRTLIKVLTKNKQGDVTKSVAATGEYLVTHDALIFNGNNRLKIRERTAAEIRVKPRQIDDPLPCSIHYRKQMFCKCCVKLNRAEFRQGAPASSCGEISICDFNPYFIQFHLQIVQICVEGRADEAWNIAVPGFEQ